MGFLIKIPMLSPQPIGTLAGNLVDGIEIMLTEAQLSGSIGVFTKAGWLYIRLALEVFDQQYDDDVRIMLLPPQISGFIRRWRSSIPATFGS